MKMIKLFFYQQYLEIKLFLLIKENIYLSINTYRMKILFKNKDLNKLKKIFKEVFPKF